MKNGMFKVSDYVIETQLAKATAKYTVLLTVAEGHIPFPGTIISPENGSLWLILKLDKNKVLVGNFGKANFENLCGLWAEKKQVQFST
jgi:hypothetical protein